MCSKLLWSMVAIAVVVSGVVLAERVRVEQDFVYEIVMDYPSVVELAAVTDQTLDVVLTRMRDAGIRRMALPERQVADNLVFEKPIPEAILDAWRNKPWQQHQLLSYPVGFWHEDMDAITRADMGVVLRPGNAANPSETWDAVDRLADSLIIFAGSQVTGYPDELAAARQRIVAGGLRIGVVEFAQQAGMGSLASADNAVRVHAITSGEMKTLSAERIVSRYLRAVRERNIRILYVRPFVTGADPMGRTLALIHKLTDALDRQGYRVGTVAPYEAWTVSLPQIFLVFLGIWAGAGLLVLQLSSKRWDLVLWLVFIGSGAAWGLAQLRLGLAQQGMALLAGLVFPCLAVSLGWRISGSQTGILQSFLRVCGVSLLGGLLVAAALSGSEYLVKLAEFRGVKLMHIAPPMFVVGCGVWIWWQPRLTTIWEWAIPVKYLFGLSLLGIVGLFYVTRTGNFGLPVSDLEIAMREGLEYVLGARPRTKEFLIGHPALVLAIASKGGWSWWWAVAVVGQLSMVNTFSHIHTPLGISILRTISGIGIGYVLGLILWSASRKAKGWISHDSRFRILRFRQPGR